MGLLGEIDLHRIFSNKTPLKDTRMAFRELMKGTSC